MGNGIDHRIGDWVGFEEAGTAIYADGFGGCGIGEAYPPGAWGDADAFDVGEFEDLEKASGPWLAGKRTAFDDASADNGVRHDLRGGSG